MSPIKLCVCELRQFAVSWAIEVKKRLRKCPCEGQEVANRAETQGASWIVAVKYYIKYILIIIA
jgi:hypothetical protein